MKLYGFALLPAVSVQERVIEFQKAHFDSIGGPVLGLTENLPHTSVLQHPYFPDVDYEEYLDEAQDCLTTTWTRYFYQPTGWLFAGVVKTPEMQELHNRLFARTRELIDVAQIDQERDLTGLTEQEQKNYRAFGYRYLGDLFTPHVTIGRTKDGMSLADRRAIDDFAREFSSHELCYDRIAFYEAGDFGALKRVVCMKRLM